MMFYVSYHFHEVGGESCLCSMGMGRIDAARCDGFYRLFDTYERAMEVFDNHPKFGTTMKEIFRQLETVAA